MMRFQVGWGSMYDARETGDTVVFEPRPSRGWAWSAGTGAAVIVITIGPFLPVLGQLHWLIVAPYFLLAVVIGVPLIVIGLYSRSMRYELTGRELWLRCGPVLNERIDLREIDGVETRDLQMSWLASYRFPGLALFTVDYIDVPRVRMCATAAAHRITLIEAGRTRYGITPADEERFMRAIEARRAIFRADAEERYSEPPDTVRQFDSRLDVRNFPTDDQP
jgi:hypothetical protein